MPNNFPSTGINISNVMLVLLPLVIRSESDLLVNIFVVVIDPNTNDIRFGQMRVVRIGNACLLLGGLVRLVGGW